MKVRKLWWLLLTVPCVVLVGFASRPRNDYAFLDQFHPRRATYVGLNEADLMLVFPRGSAARVWNALSNEMTKRGWSRDPYRNEPGLPIDFKPLTPYDDFVQFYGPEGASTFQPDPTPDISLAPYGREPGACLVSIHYGTNWINEQIRPWVRQKG